MTDEVDELIEALDWRGIYGRIATYLTQEMAEMFETAGANRGHKWPELAESTLRSKVIRGRSAEILQDTGVLRGSLQPLELTEEELVFGTIDPKAKFHDSDEPRTTTVTRRLKSGGTVTFDWHLPQRKLVRVIERDVRTVGTIIRSAIVESAVRAGHHVEKTGGPLQE